MLNYKNRSVFHVYFKGLILSMVIIFISSAISKSQVQQEVAPPIKERLFYGGSFSLTLGSITNIEIAPVVGLWVLPKFAVAAGPTYRFYKFQGDKTDIYGGRAYVQYVFFRDMDKFIPIGIHTSLFMHCEDEMLSLSSYYWRNITYEPKRFMINTVLAGVGLSQQIGARSSINIMVLWALNDPGYDIYSNPVIRIGFVF